MAFHTIYNLQFYVNAVNVNILFQFIYLCYLFKLIDIIEPVEVSADFV